jgi:hypothetical protein
LFILLNGCDLVGSFLDDAKETDPAVDTGWASTPTTATTTTPPSPTWEAQLSLSDDTLKAGEALTWTASLVDETGSSPKGLSWTISSDLETLTIVGDTAIATWAGLHTWTATTDLDGTSYQATSTVDVTAGDTSSLSLILAEDTVTAGTSTTWSFTASDTYANPITDREPVVASDSILVVGYDLSGTVAGDHFVTAELEGVTDVVTLSVEPGTPASIDLDVNPSEDLAPEDTVLASVDVFDAYGNRSFEPWSLWAEGGDVDVDGNQVTFLTEGWVTLFAECAGLSTSVGPLRIDGLPPELVLDTPDRGTWEEGSTVWFSGSVIDTVSSVPPTLTLDGVDIAVGADGSFGYAAPADEEGMHTYTLLAADDLGHTVSTMRSVIVGPSLPWEEPALDGLLLRLESDDGGLGALEALAEGLVSESEIEAMLPDPVFEDEDESCIWGVCFTWYAVDLSVSDLSFTGTTLDIDPLSSGLLQAEFTILNPEIEWDADAVVAEIPFSGSGDITATNLQIIMTLEPSVVDGELRLDVVDVDATSRHFVFDMDSWLYDVLEFFSFDGSALVEGYLLDALETIAREDLADIMEDTLGEFDLSFTLDSFDNTYDLSAELGDVNVDGYGMTLALDTTLEVGEWRSAYTGPGSLYLGYAAPSWSGATGTTLGLSLDTINQLLYAVWGGGALQMTLDPVELGIDPTLLLLFGGGDVLVQVEALLPPVAMLGTEEDPYDMQIGELFIALTSGDDYVIAAYVSGRSGLNLTSPDGINLEAELGEMDLVFDVVFPEEGAEDVATLLGDLVPLFLPDLTDALGGFAIPSLSGFGLEGVGLTTDDGYILLNGDLYAE